MSNKKATDARLAMGSAGEHRQLTIGECIALVRIADEAVTEGSPVSLGELVQALDARAVCSVCGWGEVLHSASQGTRDRLAICTSYAQGYAQG